MKPSASGKSTALKDITKTQKIALVKLDCSEFDITADFVKLPLDPVLYSVEVEEIVDRESPAPQISGAWGSRSFASAAHSASGVDVRRPNANNRSASQEIGDEWELDVAWHELEQRSAGGHGNKKKSNKLVVSGGGAGGRRR